MFRLLFLYTMFSIAKNPQSSFWSSDWFILANCFFFGLLWGASTLMVVKIIGDVEGEGEKKAAGIITEYIEIMGLIIGSVLSITLAT